MSRLVYCATPSRLAHKTKEIMDFVTARGFGPLHPFVALPLERFENGPIGRHGTMEFCCRLTEACDEFWIFGISQGTLIELRHVLEENLSFVPFGTRPKPIKLFLDEFDPDWRTEYERLKDEFGDPLALIAAAS